MGARLFIATVLIVAGFPAAASATEYQRGGASYSPSPWPDATGWQTGDGSATHTIQTSPASGGEPTTVNYRWDVPARIPADGVIGTLTIEVHAGSERAAPSFEVRSRMVHCDGIENTQSYGSGCADGSHAAVGVLAEAHETKTASQKFRLTGPPDLVRIITGGPEYVDYTYTVVPGSDDPCKTPRARAAAVNEVRVTDVVPGVEVHRADYPEGVWCPVTRGMVIKQGDEISCDPDGAVTLAFADNSTVVVRNTTQLKIASFFTEGGVVRTEILLKMGEVVSQIHKSEATKSDFRIKTPNAGGGVRGTRFRMFYDPASKASLVSTYEGVVEVDPVKPGLKTVMLRAGKEVEVTPRGVTKTTRIGRAGARGGVTRLTARDRVLKIVGRNNAPCGSTTPRENAFAIRPVRRGWRVTIKLVGTHSGPARWLVVRGKVRAANALAKTVAGGCG